MSNPDHRGTWHSNVTLTMHAFAWLILRRHIYAADETAARRYGMFEHAARLNQLVCDVEREIEARKADRS